MPHLFSQWRKLSNRKKCVLKSRNKYIWVKMYSVLNILFSYEDSVCYPSKIQRTKKWAKRAPAF